MSGSKVRRQGATAGPKTATGLVRKTMNYTPRAAQALDRIMELLGTSDQTAALNRGLPLLEEILEFIEAGGSLYGREKDGELERWKLFI